MKAGLQVINNNGIIQIDQDFRNLQYKGKYTVHLTNNPLNDDGTGG